MERERWRRRGIREEVEIVKGEIREKGGGDEKFVVKISANLQCRNLEEKGPSTGGRGEGERERE